MLMDTPRKFSAPESPKILKGFALSILATAVPFLLCYALNRLNQSTGNFAPFIVFLPAVAFSALFCGTGPAILSIFLSILATKYEFIQPIHSLRIGDPRELTNIFLFLIGSAFIAVLGVANRRDREALRKAAGDLNERVKERTIELGQANQSLRDLTARLLQLQDEERRRIARELHDSVGQSLSILAINLSTVSAEINRLITTASKVNDSAGLVRELTDDIRTISYLLHPPFLDERGLSSALRWYTEGFAERSNIQVDFETVDDLERMPQEYETAIFRLIQECLTNIHRHSGSSTAKIRITRSAAGIVVRVEDRGKGILPDKQVEMNSSGTPGVGIRGMRERVHQLGGSLEIHSDGLGKGTVVTAILPIVRASVASEATESAARAAT